MHLSYPRVFAYPISVAAATENNDDSKDDDPGAVIVKDMAQAVVIHYVCLRELVERFPRSILSYDGSENAVTSFIKIKYDLTVGNYEPCGKELAVLGNKSGHLHRTAGG